MSSTAPATLAFEDLCTKLIDEHPGNHEVENAVIDLEVAHKQSINAIKRDFNASLDQMEKDAKEENERRARRDAEDAKFHADELARIKADYERQLKTASENYKRDLERLKTSYESLVEDGKRRSSIVSQIHEDHAKELKRVKDESDRIIGNKEKEIARLMQRIDDESLSARETLHEADEQRRLLEADGAVLRKSLLDSEVARERAAVHHREEMKRLMEQQESIIRTSTNLLNQFQNKSADLELELSKVRALMFDQEYQTFRAKLREEAFKSGSSNMSKEMEELDARKERERTALAEVLDRATKAKEEQEETLRQYQKGLSEEMDKLRDIQRQKEEKGDNLVVKLPSGATVEFKTQAVPKKIDSEANANLSVNTPNASSRAN